MTYIIAYIKADGRLAKFGLSEKWNLIFKKD